MAVERVLRYELHNYYSFRLFKSEAKSRSFRSVLAHKFIILENVPSLWYSKQRTGSADIIKCISIMLCAPIHRRRNTVVATVTNLRSGQLNCRPISIRDIQIIETGSDNHQAVYWRGNATLALGVKRHKGEIDHFFQVPRLIMSSSVSPLFRIPSWLATWSD
jgi:hypothetical protein